MGVSYDEFWELNPRKLLVITEGYKLKRHIRDDEMWILGEYVFDAFSLALSNAFKKKSQKAKEYFEVVSNPILKQIEDKPDENGLTEAEKKRKTEMFFKNLEIMAANHRLGM